MNTLKFHGWQWLDGVYNELSSILFHKTRGSLFAIDEDEGLVKYDFDTNSWKQQRPINEIPTFAPNTPSAIDCKQDMIYIANNYSITQFSIHSNTLHNIHYDDSCLFNICPESNGSHFCCAIS